MSSQVDRLWRLGELLRLKRAVLERSFQSGQARLDSLRVSLSDLSGSELVCGIEGAAMADWYIRRIERVQDDASHAEEDLRNIRRSLIRLDASENIARQRLEGGLHQQERSRLETEILEITLNRAIKAKAPLLNSCKT